jgi:hypothetical protein
MCSSREMKERKMIVESCCSLRHLNTCCDGGEPLAKLYTCSFFPVQEMYVVSYRLVLFHEIPVGCRYFFLLILVPSHMSIHKLFFRSTQIETLEGFLT